MKFSNLDDAGARHITLTPNRLGYSVEEVAEQTSLSKGFLRQKIREGVLRATYFGRRVVILRADLENFLEAGGRL